MINLLIGAIAMAVVLLAIDYTRRHALRLKWWQWALTILAVIYATFVVLLVIGFLEEGVTQAALVMSLIMGLPAVIFSVMLVRFAFARRQNTSS